ncbi:hypothetical protein ABNF97_25625 [Plantactinospora sp. B6F1]
MANCCRGRWKLLAHINEELDQPIAPQVRSALREASWLDEERTAAGGPDA